MRLFSDWIHQEVSSVPSISNSIFPFTPNCRDARFIPQFWGGCCSRVPHPMRSLWIWPDAALCEPNSLHTLKRYCKNIRSTHSAAPEGSAPELGLPGWCPSDFPTLTAAGVSRALVARQHLSQKNSDLRVSECFSDWWESAFKNIPRLLWVLHRDLWHSPSTAGNLSTSVPLTSNFSSFIFIFLQVTSAPTYY